MIMIITSEISLHLKSSNELLCSPVSTYLKRKLIRDAEEFIIQEAEALPRKSAIKMKIYLALSETEANDDVASAIHRHFCYRREQTQKILQRTFDYGWRILLIAMGLLVVIFTLTELALHLLPDYKFIRFIRESFIILGWVALWRPLDLLLYDWYPIKKNINLYYRLEHSDVQVISN